MINVFQIQMSKSQRDEVNQHGWSGVAWGSVYMGLTSDDLEENVFDLIVEAIKFGLVTHTLTINTDDFDEAFEIGNGHGDLTKITERQKHKSVCVGDIFVRNHKDGAVVDNSGFIELDEKQSAVIEVLAEQV